jgi:UDP-N-acetylglucosamine transferase subunit ALG13
MALRVFVTVGTHEQSFMRLLTMAMHSTEQLDGLECAAQTGPTSIQSDCLIFSAAYLEHSDLRHWNEWADVVLTHASPGAVFDALSAEAQPIVLPRRKLYSEHVNDHQVAFARRLESLELARIAWDAPDVLQLLKTATQESPKERQARITAINVASQKRSAAFVAGCESAIDRLLTGP